MRTSGLISCIVIELELEEDNFISMGHYKWWLCLSLRGGYTPHTHTRNYSDLPMYRMTKYVVINLLKVLIGFQLQLNQKYPNHDSGCLSQSIILNTNQYWRTNLSCDYWTNNKKDYPSNWLVCRLSTSFIIREITIVELWCTAWTLCGITYSHLLTLPYPFSADQNTSYLVTGMVLDAEYVFRVRASNSTGDSEFSEWSEPILAVDPNRKPSFRSISTMGDSEDYCSEGYEESEYDPDLDGKSSSYSPFRSMFTALGYPCCDIWQHLARRENQKSFVYDENNCMGTYRTLF